MTITNLPLVSMLKSRMQWQQARQQVLAENVANASTPGFKPRDLLPPSAGPGGAGLAMEVTSPLHLAATEPGGVGTMRDGKRFETRPSGNGVNLEDEMLRVAENQSDYQLAATLYQKSLAMLRTAAGARGNG